MENFLRIFLYSKSVHTYGICAVLCKGEKSCSHKLRIKRLFQQFAANATYMEYRRVTTPRGRQ